MAELSLALLGPPIVERDGTVVGFDTKKAVALLAVLAITGREQSRDRLAGLLWPESDTARARGSLRRTLSVTAAAVGEGLAITRTTVALRPDRMRVDVTDFGALAARPDLASLERAARLYRDDFLAGFSLRDCPEFEGWQASAASSWRSPSAGGCPWIRCTSRPTKRSSGFSPGPDSVPPRCASTATSSASSTASLRCGHCRRPRGCTTTCGPAVWSRCRSECGVPNRAAPGPGTPRGTAPRHRPGISRGRWRGGPRN